MGGTTMDAADVVRAAEEGKQEQEQDEQQQQQQQQTAVIGEVVAPASPVVVFLNSASGGKMGPTVLERIRALIPDTQVFDLQEVSQGKWKPEDKLKLFEARKETKVLICGGDGTMGWILSCIDRLHMSVAPPPLDSSSSPSPLEENPFPVAMMPLGTGNDLARTYGWGHGFQRRMLKPKFLDKVLEAPPAKLDRWLLSVMPYTPLGDDAAVKRTKIPPTFSVHRYSSAIGSPVGVTEDVASIPESEHKRTQSVVRMGRSFSVKMSLQALSVHEDEMTRSSSQGSRSLTTSRHGHRDGGFAGNFAGAMARGEGKAEETTAESDGSAPASGAGGGPPSMERASSAPPALRYTGGGTHVGGGTTNAGGSAGVVAMPTVGEHDDGVVVVVAAEGKEVSSASSSREAPDNGAQEKVTPGDGTGVVAVDLKTTREEAATGNPSPTRSNEVTGAMRASAAVDGKDGVASKNSTGAPAGAPVDGGGGGGGSGADGGSDGAIQVQERHQQPSLPSGGEGHAAEEADGEVNGVVSRGAAATAVGMMAAAEARQSWEEKSEAIGDSNVKSKNNDAAVQTDSPTRRPGLRRALPSMSVIQRFETWESYDAVFCNYFSFGVDAIAASAFHEHRQAYPQLFTSRLRNQVWYARKGFPAAGGIPCSNPPPPPVSRYLELRVKRTREGDWEPLEIDDSLRGVVVLNLQSYGGGRNLWGTAEGGCSQTQYAKAAPDDGLLEIVGVSNIFKLGCIMGFNKAGARAHRITQAAEVELRIRSEIHMQIDGEPWKQAPAKINIQHYGQSTCLHGRR